MPHRHSFDTSATLATRAGWLACALSSAILLIAPPILAQHPSPTGRTLKGCYVASTGTVYIVGEPNTPGACGTTRKTPDVPVNLFDGGGALRVGTATAALDGFAVTGTQSQGTLITSGPGIRLLWYPGKGAFRAGHVTGAEWDDANIGLNSVGLGLNAWASAPNSIALGSSRASGSSSMAQGSSSVASGGSSIALGDRAKASGVGAISVGSQTEAIGNMSVAMGQGTVALGDYSTAFGRSTVAAGAYSAAIGLSTAATGTGSTAMGSHAASAHQGAFVIGDYIEATMFVDALTSSAADQFSTRFAGGYRLFTNKEHSAGVMLAPGAGAWESVSDVRKKTAFHTVDGEELLSKLAAMPMQTWQYKSQDASIRHMGPTAQDFRAAFGLGGSDTTITTIDADGVALAAAKALEGRTRAALRDIAELRAANATLAAENAELRRWQQENDGALAARVARLERALDAAARTPARTASVTSRAADTPGTGGTNDR